MSDEPLRACLHGVGDPGLVGLVSFVSRSGGHKTKETYPTRPGSPTPCKQGLRNHYLSLALENTQAIVFGARDIVGSSIYYFVSKFYRQLVLRDKKQP